MTTTTKAESSGILLNDLYECYDKCISIWEDESRGYWMDIKDAHVKDTERKYHRIRRDMLTEFLKLQPMPMISVLLDFTEERIVNCTQFAQLRPNNSKYYKKEISSARALRTILHEVIAQKREE